MAMTSSNLWTHALSKPYLLFLLTADVYMLTNGNDIIKFVDDAQLRIKSLSASVYVDPHKVRLCLLCVCEAVRLGLG